MRQLDAKNAQKRWNSQVVELNCNLWAKFFPLHSKPPFYYGAPLCRDSRARHGGKAGRQCPVPPGEPGKGISTYNWKWSSDLYLWEPRQTKHAAILLTQVTTRNVGELHTVPIRSKKVLIQLGDFSYLQKHTKTCKTTVFLSWWGISVFWQSCHKFICIFWMLKPAYFFQVRMK